ncbi:MAG TPA: NADH:flavin oxidoreductase/NADH oxidase [Gallionella sp.]
MSQLFTPIQIGGLSLPNRIVVAPMCQYSAENGEATDWHLIHLGQLAISGAGLLIIEATSVSPEGRITPGDLGLYSEATESALANVLQSVKRYSRIPIAIQLAHAGRKASSYAPWEGGALIPTESGGWRTVSPSAIAHIEGEELPVALDDAGLERTLKSFAEAARRADRIGIDAIEVHAAHGYLLHQFLSPHANKRNDAYGGSLQNRMRFPLSVFREVREAFSLGKPVGVRISATDWIEGGWDVEESIALCKALEALGCAYIHVSSGGVSIKQKIPLGPGYQVHLADQIKKQVSIPVIAVGLITEPEQAETILASGQADMVALARGMLYDPRWPWHAAVKLGAKLAAPHQYWRAQPHGQESIFSESCTGQR